jgi:exopolysaccharide biosynthesis polyprenyl glycosylphosphotransferase
MLREKNDLLRRVQLFLDVGITAFSFVLAYHIRSNMKSSLPAISPISYYLFLLYIILPVWAFLLRYNKAYATVRTRALLRVLAPVVKTVIVGAVLLMSFMYVFKIQTISRTLIVLFLILNGALLVFERVLLYAFLRHIRTKGLNYRTILIVGTGRRAKALAQYIRKHSEWGLKIVGFVDDDPALVGRELGGSRVIGALDDMQDILINRQVDEVIFVVPRKWLDRIEEAVLLCEQLGRKARIAADLYPHEIARMQMEQLRDWRFLSFNPTSRLDEVSAVKRLVDIALSLVILLLMSPLFLLIAAAIKLTSDGPVFFKQKRVGLNGRQFNMLKFRTMLRDAERMKAELQALNEVSGPVFKIRKDPRITPIGRILRKYSLDELPQFINVLKGDMSVVGPRPSIPTEVDAYDLWQRRRLSVRPGITCLWQVGGRNAVDFENWVKLDLEYIDNLSLSLDFKIILKTIPAVFTGSGM